MSGPLAGSASAVALRGRVVRTPSASLHSASIHVTNLSHLTNPVPVSQGVEGSAREGEEMLRFGDDYLSPTKLRELSGESDLSRVTYLKISVNTLSSSLGNFGCSLPSLEQLRCVDSILPCVRDLGTGLSQLTVLWLPQCGLHDLDGLPSLLSLKELYISHNTISDVSVVAMLPNLQVLDLERNQVSEADQIGYLGLCPELSSLSLTGNPLAQVISQQQGGEAGYRAWILKALPQLKVLDEISVAVLTSQPSLDLSLPPLHQSPSTPAPSLSPGLSPPPGPSLSPGLSMAVGLLPQRWTAVARPRTALSPGQAECVSVSGDSSSDLTHGLSQVICGNPVRALKARRSSRSGISSQSSVFSSSSTHSASLEAMMEELSVTRTSSSEDLMVEVNSHLHSLSSSTPAYVLPKSSNQPLTQEPHRQLPSPPSTQPSRPQSATDFRYRRYHRPNPGWTRPASEHAQSITSTQTSMPFSPHNHPTS